MMTGQIHFISAGAGSGKTYRLTELLYAELNSGNVRASGVIATTFTKKAAAELRERVRADLLIKGEHNLAQSLGQARIGTINSVCGSLLQRFAFEGGLATELAVLDESQSALLIRQAIDTVLESAEVARLVRISQRLGIEDWRDALQELINQARSNGIDEAHLSGLGSQNADDLLQHFIPVTSRDLNAELLNAIQSALPSLNALAEQGGKKKTIDYLEQVTALQRSLKEGQSVWSAWIKLSKSEPEAALRVVAEPITGLADQVESHPGLHQDIRDYLEQMFDLASRVLKEYRESKLEWGVLDFTDQEHLLLKVLDHPQVADVLRAELDLLLVDEFQDTSPMQLALFQKLARFAKTIYWVGDIKQAIYGFRGSDTELMQAILDALPDMGGKKEILSASWRSRKPLVQLVNNTFVKAFSEELDPGEVELTAQRKDAVPGPGFSNWILSGKNKEDEAISLVAGIQRLVGAERYVFDKHLNQARPLRYGDIAVLARTNPGVVSIASRLRGSGIPCATAQPGLLRTPEGRLALACLRRLHDVGDTIASAEILMLADCVEPEAIVNERLRYLGDEGKPDLWREQSGVDSEAHPVLSRLAELRSTCLVLTPAEALQEVVNGCHLTRCVLQWRQDVSVARMRLANLEALQGMAVAYEDSCRGIHRPATLPGLILWLGECAENGSDALPETSVDAVKVLTHHGAKGLEWPVTILTDLSAKIRNRLWGVSPRAQGEIDAQNPLANRTIRYWPWPFGKQSKTRLTDRLSETELAKSFQQAAVEEGRRLLYVSMTRARDLMILARSERSPNGEWLNTLDAPWLLPEDSEEAELNLPNGETIETETWELQPDDLEDALIPEQAQLFWFAPGETASKFLPLRFSPSEASTTQVELGLQVNVGTRIHLPSGIDMSHVGDVMHACIATAFIRRTPLVQRDIEDILQRMCLPDLDPLVILDQVNTFHAWTYSNWCIKRALPEYPVQSVLDSGQVLNGRIDLLLELDDGWIVIDHKSNPAGKSGWAELVHKHAGQLAAYAKAIQSASSKPVKECWLFFLISGGAVSMQLPEIQG